MSAPPELDLTRVICRVSDLAPDTARAFCVGGGEWPLRGLVLNTTGGVRAFVNRCPHAGHPLDLVPGRFLSADGALIVCCSHGAVFDKESGLCLAGPCAGRSLTPVAVQVFDDLVLLAEAPPAEAPPAYSNRSMPS
ncbi:MAG: Rieske (2Fe-2S) protein [Proteobacteria bacterium]|nr:Rieske (2Fe-2S) protein [Pseudomonadota bacterium]